MSIYLRAIRINSKEWISGMIRPETLRATAVEGSTHDHPDYTIDAQYACAATKPGDNHQCHCVYRQAVCNGIYHLCMCGDDWTGACTCSPNPEKENTMATPVSTTLTSTQGEFVAEVSISGDGNPLHPASVAAEQLRRANKAMQVLLNRGDDDEEEE